MEILHLKLGDNDLNAHHERSLGVCLAIDKFVLLAYNTSSLYQILKQSDNYHGYIAFQIM